MSGTDVAYAGTRQEQQAQGQYAPTRITIAISVLSAEYCESIVIYERAAVAIFQSVAGTQSLLCAGTKRSVLRRARGGTKDASHGATDKESAFQGQARYFPTMYLTLCGSDMALYWCLCTDIARSTKGVR
eukprot:3321005-Rhodomonas_salina.1